MPEVHSLCDEHVHCSKSYFERKENGFEWFIKDETGATNCHCGKTATWLLMISDD
jgi:hypothetical protein